MTPALLETLAAVEAHPGDGMTAHQRRDPRGRSRSHWSACLRRLLALGLVRVDGRRYYAASVPAVLTVDVPAGCAEVRLRIVQPPPSRGTI